MNCRIRIFPLAVALTCLLMLVADSVFAGAHGGAKVSDVEKLPARTGDWTPEEVARGREQLIRADRKSVV